MEIEQGFRIHINKRKHQNRISLSQGIKEVLILNTVDCANRTFIPREPWRKPTLSELNKLISEDKINTTYQDVALLSLPKNLIKIFKKIGLDKSKTINEAIQKTKTKSYEDVVNSTINFFQKKSERKIEHKEHNIYFGKNKLTTTTWNKSTKSYIGLHLDNFEAFDSEFRHHARNRICINLGKEPRYLLFYNLEFRQMKKKFKIIQDDYNGNPYLVLHKFFEEYKNYPVVRIKIMPYELYLAPTENIVHDGSTINTNSPDINLAIRGFFDIPKFSFFDNFNLFSK